MGTKRMRLILIGTNKMRINITGINKMRIPVIKYYIEEESETLPTFTVFPTN